MGGILAGQENKETPSRIAGSIPLHPTALCTTFPPAGHLSVGLQKGWIYLLSTELFNSHIAAITVLPLEDSHGIWDVLNTQILQLLTKCCETCRWLSTQANSTCSSQLLAGCHVQAHSVLGKLVGNKHRLGEVKNFRFFYRSVANSP